ncbi:GATOR complex protein WDR24-like [Physella acuta]|uniref:GATOR complex protein WDR24-like n=1 Tax=Physella acuta TaxID=109671 RepID=UPI0027DE3AEF|nr:GATOR complex protein WDR24-like [Physella acuta]
MASKQKKSDPLSRYFKDLDECDLSSSDDDESKVESIKSTNNKSQKVDRSTSNVNNSNSSADTTSPNKSKRNSGSGNEPDLKSEEKKNTNVMKTTLPSAHDCLASKNTPGFLKVLDSKELNWDKLEKRLDNDNADQQITDFKTNAVPPPSSYEPVTDPGIKVVDNEGRKRKKLGDDLEDQMTSTKAYKVHKEEDQDSS